MKAINDYRILMPNVPYYETGILFNEFEIVYYTGINAGTYTDPNTFPSPKIETVVNPIAGKTGYYYLSSQRFFTASQNVFWTRPDSPDNVIYDSSPSFIVEGKNDFAVWTQDFFFKPTYGSKITFTANFYENNFQDNYQYILGKSENVILVEADLNFQGITDNEARAINHFYQNYYTKNTLPSGQGMQTINIGLFYPHEKVRPYYLNTINNNLENVDFNNIVLSFESPFTSITSWQEKLIPFSNANVYFDTSSYEKHDYVFPFRSSNSSDGFFYYSGDVSSKNISPYSIDPANHWTQKFYFSPDLVQGLNFNSSKNKNDLNNFYLYQNEGINPNTFNFDIQFNNRSDKEAKALLHFLENHNGVELFQYDMFPPFTGTRSFYCPQWSHTINFKDNHSVQAKFIESKIDYIYDRNFNTTLIPPTFNFDFVPIGFTKTLELKIKNEERKPITFTLGADKVYPVSDQNTDVDFVALIDQLEIEQVGAAGGYAVYDLLCKVPLTTKDLYTNNFYYTGQRSITQENENLGIISDTDLSFIYSGLYYDDGQNVPNKFLSGLKKCVAAPYYNFDLNQLCLKTQFTIPESGYYYTDFSGRLATTSGAFSVGNFTGSSKAVNKNLSTQLYDIGTPNDSFFSMDFTGLKLGVDYYVRVSGYNYDYLGKNSGDFVFASGVNNLNSPITNNQVISGLTLNNLQSFNINPPSIRIDGKVEQFTISGPDENCFNLYQFLENNARFGVAFPLYSGININFQNVNYGPLNPNIVDDCFDTGVFIITGDYSVMPSGVTLNFYNSKVIGKGGNVVRDKTKDITYLGRNGFYINCSGIININKDSSSIFAGGGAAGDNIDFIDIVNVNNGKYATIKDSICPQGELSNADTQDFKQRFNAAELSQNINYTNTKGSSVLYDFFTPLPSEPYLVYGGAGAGMGEGTGVYNGKTFVNNATKISPSANYVLFGVVEYQASKYPKKQGK